MYTSANYPTSEAGWRYDSRTLSLAHAISPYCAIEHQHAMYKIVTYDCDKKYIEKNIEYIII